MTITIGLLAILCFVGGFLLVAVLWIGWGYIRGWQQKRPIE
jgi:hypothetical protein